MSNLLISLNKALELFLEAVVLVVQVSHMLVKSIYFGLKVNLVSHHLLGVLLQPIDLISHRLLVLLKFVKLNFQLRAF